MIYRIEIEKNVNKFTIASGIIMMHNFIQSYVINKINEIII